MALESLDCPLYCGVRISFLLHIVKTVLGVHVQRMRGMTRCLDTTTYWLPMLHKRPYKARFIANSSSCTTTEFSKLLTSCLTAVKNHVIRYCEKVYERSVKNLFWSIKILVRYLIN